MSTLKEIKSGNTGYGLLVENDGFVSLSDKKGNLLESFKMNEDINGEFHCPYPFVVPAVFQKYFHFLPLSTGYTPATLPVCPLRA